MTSINLAAAAADLPAAWKSTILGHVGQAAVKVLRMDELPVAEESHGSTEALLVVDGVLELVVEGVPRTIGAGELYLVPAGARHTVRPGSRGTLLIIEMPED